MDWHDPFAIPIAGGIAIHDISDILPRHKWRQYKPRKKNISTLFMHHSGADSGLDAAEAFAAMADYHVRVKEWPSIAYHYGISARHTIDSSGRYVIYRLGSSGTHRYHTKGCNAFGEGLVLQGHHGKEPLSPFQVECLEAFIPWWMETFDRNYKSDLGWHSNSWKWLGIPKPACPGKHVVKWLKGYVRDERIVI